MNDDDLFNYCIDLPKDILLNLFIECYQTITGDYTKRDYFVEITKGVDTYTDEIFLWYSQKKEHYPLSLQSNTPNKFDLIVEDVNNNIGTYYCSDIGNLIAIVRKYKIKSVLN
jgi:hypothetical protein